MLGVIQDHVRPSSLRCVVLYHILNENTQDVIFEGTRVSTSTLDKLDGHKEYTETDDGFYALLGSILGNYVVNMLLDHKAEIEYKYVDRIVLFGKKNMAVGREWESARSVMILLSEPRSRKRAATAPPEIPSSSTKRRRLNPRLPVEC